MSFLFSFLFCFWGWDGVGVGEIARSNPRRIFVCCTSPSPLPPIPPTPFPISTSVHSLSCWLHTPFVFVFFLVRNTAILYPLPAKPLLTFRQSRQSCLPVMTYVSVARSQRWFAHSLAYLLTSSVIHTVACSVARS